MTMGDLKRISLGSDHGGFELKELISSHLKEIGHEVLDRGCFDPGPVDYPDVAALVCSDLLSFTADLGILVCGTGIGMCNAASRLDGIVAALCTNEYMARMARMHNDANVLCLGGRVTGTDLALSIIDEFIEAIPLQDDRYLRRRDKVRGMG
ncbi:MAG: ribose 5-phosphate isomerase B [Candidatus Thermoplasmatota archaeon]|nr:ribose 5-phosphate isomerase B [Candidatus Thermoplasmatota archaeon]